ncbi:MAG: TetR/AcrR family transcriptional regulator [Rhodobacterales bacterium]|nr:TetR/AcrR family transcriptional regulator [Rhodobacterales bacterium]
MVSSDKQETRSRILRAVWTLMEGNRGQGARMSDIAKAAGISRQALYLHFDNRADLLVATTRYMDEVQGVEDLLRPSREATTGAERLREFVSAMGAHFPNVQGMARALLAIKDTDKEAQAAWNERMGAIREGCAAAIEMLADEGELPEVWSVETATALFWSMLSFETWDQLTTRSGWDHAQYTKEMQALAMRSFVKSC